MMSTSWIIDVLYSCETDLCYTLSTPIESNGDQVNELNFQTFIVERGKRDSRKSMAVYITRLDVNAHHLDTILSVGRANTIEIDRGTC